MDLDMDICPAPGMENKADELAAKATAGNIRSQLSELGFNPEIFDINNDNKVSSGDLIHLASNIVGIEAFVIEF